MQRLRGRITLQSWATLSLLAMLAVFTSPALAFACCCHPTPAAASHPGISSAAKPDADGCCEEKQAHLEAEQVAVKRVAIEQGTYPKHAHGEAAKAHANVPAISDICHCAHSTSSLMAFVDSQSSSSFSPLVMGAASARFAFSVSSDERIAVSFASRALRPRPPTGASQSGRAPPVFSL